MSTEGIPYGGPYFFTLNCECQCNCSDKMSSQHSQLGFAPVEWLPALVADCHELLKRTEELVLDAATCRRAEKCPIRQSEVWHNSRMGAATALNTSLGHCKSLLSCVLTHFCIRISRRSYALNLFHSRISRPVSTAGITGTRIPYSLQILMRRQHFRVTL